MTEIETLAAQLRALTAAVDRLTARIDALPLAADGEVDLRPNPVADAFAWPSEEELGRYLASTGRTPGARP